VKKLVLTAAAIALLTPIFVFGDDFSKDVRRSLDGAVAEKSGSRCIALTAFVSGNDFSSDVKWRQNGKVAKGSGRARNTRFKRITSYSPLTSFAENRHPEDSVPALARSRVGLFVLRC
jgi:hypothetical protein